MQMAGVKPLVILVQRKQPGDAHCILFSPAVCPTGAALMHSRVLRPSWQLESPEAPFDKNDEAVLDAARSLLHCDSIQGSFTFGVTPKVPPPHVVAEQLRKEAGGLDIKSYLHNNCKVHFLGRPKYLVESIGTKKDPLYKCTVRLGGRAKGLDFVGEPGITRMIAEWQAATVAWEWIKGFKPVVRKEKAEKEVVKKEGQKDRRALRKANKELEARWEEWRKKYQEEEAAKRRAMKKQARSVPSHTKKDKNENENENHTEGQMRKVKKKKNRMVKFVHS